MQELTRYAFSRYQSYTFYPNCFSETYHRFLSTFREISAMFSSGFRKRLGNVEAFTYHGANPQSISETDAERPAIILVHGAQHNQSGWMPLIKKLHERKIGPVYTLNYTQEKRQELLQKTIEKVKQQYQQKGKNPSVILVGHSFGGTVVAEYFFGENQVVDVTVKKVIAIDARLKITNNAPFPSMFEDIIPIVNKLYDNIINSQEKEKLFTISAKRSWLMPLSASQIYENGQSILPETNRCIVEDCSHLSVLYSPKTEDKIIQWVSV